MTSVVFNFQRESNSWNKGKKLLHDTEKGKDEGRYTVERSPRWTEELYSSEGVAIMLQKLESPGPREYYRKGLQLPKPNPMVLYISFIQVTQFSEPSVNQ